MTAFPYKFSHLPTVERLTGNQGEVIETQTSRVDCLFVCLFGSLARQLDGIVWPQHGKSHRLLAEHGSACRRFHFQTVSYSAKGFHVEEVVNHIAHDPKDLLPVRAHLTALDGPSSLKYFLMLNSANVALILRGGHLAIYSASYMFCSFVSPPKLYS